MTSADPALERWLSQILDRDPMTFEHAYWGRRPEASVAVPRLIALLRTAHDAGTRGRILELLGESGDPAVACVISAELDHADAQVRTWAGLALAALEHGSCWQPSDPAADAAPH